VFNLVGKRYLFLIISLIVIIPGLLSLVIKGMNSVSTSPVVPQLSYDPA